MTSEKERELMNETLDDNELEDVSGGWLPTSGNKPRDLLKVFCKKGCLWSDGKAINIVAPKDKARALASPCPYCGGEVYIDGSY